MKFTKSLLHNNKNHSVACLPMEDRNYGYSIGMIFSSCLFLLLILSGCSQSNDELVKTESFLKTGVWKGDVATSDGSPFGAMFHITESESGVNIRLESQYITQLFTNVVVTKDTLQFIWPLQTPRNCLLLRESDFEWKGDCLGEGTDPITLWMVYPGYNDVPTGVARTAYESDIRWIQKEIGQLIVMVQDGGNAISHAEYLFEGAVAAFDNAFAELEETPPGIPFWIIYVDSRADMQKIVGRPVGGWADGVARTAVNTVSTDGRSPDYHEVMHVAATVAWGVPSTPWAWINEGLATYASGDCAGAKIHPLSAALIDTGSAVSLNHLIYNFWEVDEISAYLQSASVVGYIRETYGVGAVRRIWQGGPEAISAAMGMEINQLESDWLRFVSEQPPATEALKTIRVEGCF